MEHLVQWSKSKTIYFLNYQIQMPSFLAYIFIKKSPVKNKSELQIIPSLDFDSEDFKTGLEIESITMKQKFNDFLFKLPNKIPPFRQTSL